VGLDAHLASHVDGSAQDFRKGRDRSKSRCQDNGLDKKYKQAGQIMWERRWSQRERRDTEGTQQSGEERMVEGANPTGNGTCLYCDCTLPSRQPITDRIATPGPCTQSLCPWISSGTPVLKDRNRQPIIFISFLLDHPGFFCALIQQVLDD
jgi:hypothetical protein